MPVVRTAIRVRPPPGGRVDVSENSAGIYPADVDSTSVTLRVVQPSSGAIQAHKFSVDLVLPLHTPKFSFTEKFVTWYDCVRVAASPSHTRFAVAVSAKLGKNK